MHADVLPARRRRSASEMQRQHDLAPARVRERAAARGGGRGAAVSRWDRLGVGTCAATDEDLSASTQPPSRDSSGAKPPRSRTYPGYGCVSSGYWIRSPRRGAARGSVGYEGGKRADRVGRVLQRGRTDLCALAHAGHRVRSPLRAIVQGPGWLGLKDAKLYVRYHEALVEAGFGVLVIDYRGFGDSGGPKELSPRVQLEDLVNAVTYLTTRDDVDADAIGVFGTGGTGGGNAILLAAADARVRAAVSQVPGRRRRGLAAPDAVRVRLARVPRLARGRPQGARRSPARAAACIRARRSWSRPPSAARRR